MGDTERLDGAKGALDGRHRAIRGREGTFIGNTNMIKEHTKAR